MKPAPPRRLRRELLLWLMLPLLAIVALSGVVGAFTAQRLTDHVFDRWLLDAARSLADQVHFVDGNARLELPAVAEAMLAYDEIDHVFYSIEQDGRHLLGQRGIPRAGTRPTQYRNGRAFDARYAGRTVRVAAVEIDAGGAGHATVLMAETTGKRDSARQEVLAMLLPLGLLLLAAAAAIDLAVRRTLRPLEAIASRWNARSQASLEPIAADDLPRELMPFAAALNELLARIRAMLARERQFASNVAHQLRTPLAGIRLGLARAADAPDLASARRVLGELDRSSQRTARLVQQLLSLGRLDPEARGDMNFVPTDLASLAHDVGAAYLETAIDKRIRLELRAPAQPLWATVQPELLAEAFGNLLDNALRHTPPGGFVVIEFDADPPAVRIADSGPGVAPDERDAVFERSVRGSDSVGVGSGLGLAIVRDIAALHDATVTMTASEWGGACVTLRFAAAAAGAQAAHAAPRGASHAPDRTG